VPELMYVRLSADPESPASWIVLDDQGRRAGTGGSGSLERAAEAAEGRRLVALVPGTDVVSTQAVLPVTSQARLRQMLPYSLEESLAHDVERLAFAVGPRLEEGAVSVAVVARERLEGWLAVLAEAGLRPHAMYADAEGVPDTPGTLTLLIEGERIYGRRPAQAPFVLEGLSLVEVLELVSAESPDAPDLRHMVVYADEVAGARHQQALAELRGRLASVDLKLLGDGVTAHLAATLAQHPGTNLLQGEYAPQSNWKALARPWRLAAGLMAALVGLGLLAQAVDYVTLARADRALGARVAVACERQFATTSLSACEGEVRRALERAGEPVEGGGETFLSTIAAVAQSRHPASRIEALSYRNRTMDLQLTMPNVPALDEFGRRLSDTQRFDVRIQSTRSGDTGVEGRVQVSEVRR
jgi:general secretion pathway protein L